MGPYASSAARAWLANARRLLDYAVEHRAQLPISLPPEAIDSLRWYLDEWEAAGSKADAFRWSGEVTASELRTLLTYWVNLARLTGERSELPVSEGAARDFYPAVVGDLVDLLEQEPGQREFCERLRTAWPGLDADCDR